MRSRAISQVEKPFKGRPHTRLVQRRKGYMFVVRIDELTPMRAMIADAFGWITAIALFAGGIYIAYELNSEEPLAWAGILLGPWVMRPCLQWLWGVLLRKELVLRYDGNLLRRSGWFVHPFNAEWINGFAIREHWYGQKEARNIERRQAEGSLRRQVVRPKIYFGDSRTLVVEYYGEDRELMHIYPLQRAKHVARRLQAIHSIIESNAADTSEPYEPQSDWATDSPGEF